MNEKKVLYSDVESEYLNVFDLINNPQNYIIEDISEKEFCKTCHQELRKYKNKNYIKYICGCGCRIKYPRENGIKLSKWISADKYKEGD